MATSDEIGRERQRVSEQLARLDAERAKLAYELNELEIAERVLTRFGKTAGTIERRRRERPARTAPVAREAPRARRRREAPTVALRDAVLRAVEAHRGGAAASDVLTYLSQEFGMTVRPNHLGMALQRHRRAGRLELRDQRWSCTGHNTFTSMAFLTRALATADCRRRHVAPAGAQRGYPRRVGIPRPRTTGSLPRRRDVSRATKRADDGAAFPASRGSGV